MNQEALAGSDGPSRIPNRDESTSGGLVAAESSFTSLVHHSGSTSTSPPSPLSPGPGSSLMDLPFHGQPLGFDYEFVPAVDVKYICPICILVLRQPVQTECGHRFCAGCIRQWLNQSSTREPECPSCKEKITGNQIFPDNFAKREIMNLTVRCPNAKNGCDILVDLHHVQSHLNSQCEYALCPCPNNCPDILLRKDLNHHVTDTCPNFWITCHMCQEKICRSNHEAHLSICPMLLELCCYCGNKFHKNKMSNHHDVDCLMVTVNCSFQTFGCQFKCVRQSMPNHVETSVSDHLQLLAKHMMVLQQHMNLLPSSITFPATVYDIQQPGLFSPNRYQSMDSGLPQVLVPEGLNREVCDLVSTTSDAGFVSGHVSTMTPAMLSPLPNSELFRLTQIERVERSYTSPEPLSGESTSSSSRSRLSVDDAKHSTTLQELSRSFSNLQQVFTQQADRLASLESVPEDIVARHCNGCYLWRIENVEKHREAAKVGTATALHSRGFYTSIYGYKICIRINLNGIEKGFNRHIALFVHFMKGDYDDLLDWPFQGTITLSILDQSKTNGVRNNYTESLEANPKLAAFAKPTTSRNHKGFGYIEFAPLSILDDLRYIKNSVLFIRAFVRVSDIISS